MHCMSKPTPCNTVLGYIIGIKYSRIGEHFIFCVIKFIDHARFSMKYANLYSGILVSNVVW